MELALYVHIPFCIRKCSYCDFRSFAGTEEQMREYLRLLKTEAALRADASFRVSSVFFGGGTPSLLPLGEVAGMMRELSRLYEIMPGAEVTLEANPGTLTREKLLEYRSCGVNRLSIGVQSLQDAHLKTLGRAHTAREALEALTLAEEAGFDNLSADLMFGLPGQTTAEFAQTLHRLVGLKPAHLSVYSLTLEEGTPLFKRLGGALDNEEEDREMYHQAARILGQAGYGHYETSNFALPGYECRHNLAYWTSKQYLGLGLSAHSYLKTSGQWARMSNTVDLETYGREVSAGRAPIAECVVLTEKDRMFEYIMLSLRLGRGIRFDECERRFGFAFEKMFQQEIREAVCMGLARSDGESLQPTLKGFDLQNYLIGLFLNKL